MIKTNFITLFISLLVITACHEQPSPILGHWVNTEDKNSHIIIENKLIYQLYNNDTISANNYQLTNQSCDTNYISKNVTNLEFIAMNDGTCFEITGLNATLLSFRHTVSGKLQEFRKR